CLSFIENQGAGPAASAWRWQLEVREGREIQDRRSWGALGTRISAVRGARPVCRTEEDRPGRIQRERATVSPFAPACHPGDTGAERRDCRFDPTWTRLTPPRPLPPTPSATAPSPPGRRARSPHCPRAPTPPPG